jgi:putative membrane protein
MMMGGFGGYGGFGSTMMIVNTVITLAVLIGLVWLVIWAVRRFSANSTSNGFQNGSAQSAKDFTQIRYAKGEITREEYQQILLDLNH